MDAFIARQPIFDRNLDVYAYELLYRSGEANYANATDGDAATFTVIKNSLMIIGLDTITDGKLAFINFTKKLIDDRIPTVFSQNEMVVEILEDVIPDEAFIEKLKELKALGYKLALDDFVLDYKYHDIIELVDIIKVDFMQTCEFERKKIYHKYKNRNIEFLAEKVETLQEYKNALKMDYKYFQGYFFSKPVIVKGQNIQALSVNYLRVINELERKDPEIGTIAAIIESDVALTYKLLRYINSAAFYKKSTVKSVNHALVHLGLKEIKKWITIAMIQDLGADKPDEIIKSSLVRGKMSELLAESFDLEDRKSELFLVGMLSMIDTLMNCSKELALKQLPLADDIKAAILGEKNALEDILRLVVAYGKGDWSSMLERKPKELQGFPDAYLEAVKWANEIFSSCIVCED